MNVFLTGRKTCSLSLIFACNLLAVSACSAEPTIADADLNADTHAAQQDSFVHGNILDIMFHEMGHAVIDQYDIPILGQEEDAADNLSAVLLIGSDRPHMIDAVASAAEGYFLMDELGAEREEAFAFDDEHDLDIQRAYRQVCYLYGYSDAFDELAEMAELSPERAENCEEDFERMSQNWERVLTPHHGPSIHSIAISYAPAKRKYQSAKTALENSGALEETAQFFTQRYALTKPLTFHAEQCGEANAFYDAQESRVTFCYEYVSLLTQLNHFAQTGNSRAVKD